MSRADVLLHLIYLRPDGMLLSKKPYADWREIQDEYEGYMASLGPFTPDALLEYLPEEYGAEELSRWGFTAEEVRAFIDSDAEVLEAR